MVSCTVIEQFQNLIKANAFKRIPLGGDTVSHEEIINHLKTCRNSRCLALAERLREIEEHTQVPGKPKEIF